MNWIKEVSRTLNNPIFYVQSSPEEVKWRNFWLCSKYVNIGLVQNSFFQTPLLDSVSSIVGTCIFLQKR